MGGEQTELQGPDLTQGVPVEQIADGQMLLGHANGEAVLVARRGAEWFALGAVCTHYSGPLAEGLVVEDTVRCPWHHACFSLRTGAALAAPALDPVACWTTETRGGKLYVTGKREPRQGQAPHVIAGAPASVVIIGMGAAGTAAAQMLRRRGYQGQITMLDGDQAAPYDRPNLSKDYLAGTAPEDWLPLRPPEFFTTNHIDVRRIRASRIDRAKKTITLGDGSTLGYDALLLATGADPVKLPIPVSHLSHVYYLRTLADARAIIARAKTSRRAVIMGASFIGLEVAASLRARGLQVDVVAPEALPLERVMGPELGAFLQRLHEEHGVVFHLQQTATAIDDHTVTLRNGTTLEADLVVIGIGVRPALALAEWAKLETDRGVVVDEYLRTSDAAIFAAGDIARWPDPHTGERIRVEHWVVAERQGQVAARNILGERIRYTDVPFFWSAHYDVVIDYVGHAERWDRIEMSGDPDARDCTAAFRVGDRTLAVATIFRDRQNLEIEVAMERNEWPRVAALAGA